VGVISVELIAIAHNFALSLPDLGFKFLLPIFEDNLFFAVIHGDLNSYSPRLVSIIVLHVVMEKNGFRVSKATNGVAEIVFARPEKLNTISVEVCANLAAIVRELDQDDSVRVMLIWAEGRMFTAGLDLNQLMPLRSNRTAHSWPHQSGHSYRFSCSGVSCGVGGPEDILPRKHPLPRNTPPLFRHIPTPPHPSFPLTCPPSLDPSTHFSILPTLPTLAPPPFSPAPGVRS